MSFPSSSSPQGYRKKPLGIYFLAGVFILSPLGNLLLTLFFYENAQWYSPRLWVYWISKANSLSLVANCLVFASGIALLYVRRWTWILSTVAVSTVLIHDLFYSSETLKIGMQILVILLLGTLAGLVFILSERFRRPYVNPRVRWWETAPRYRGGNLEAHFVRPENRHPAHVIDISRTGVLLKLENALQESDDLQHGEVDFPSYKLLLRVKRVRMVNNEALAFHFVDNPRGRQKQLKSFIRELSRDPSRFMR